MKDIEAIGPGGKYTGKKKSNKGLSRWFKEKWKTQDGKTEYKKKGDLKNTPNQITLKL